MSKLTVLYEDNHLLVINKPCGLATMGVANDVPSLVRLAADYIKHKYHKPGKVYLGIVSRLDALASGVLVLARTSKAASRISEQIRQHHTTKVYLALVEGPMAVSQQWTDSRIFVKKDEARQRMLAVDKDDPQAQHAELMYRCRSQRQNLSVLEVLLITGRKHQIRLQLSALGFPIVGDRKYGARQPWNQIAQTQDRRVKGIKSAKNWHKKDLDSSGTSASGIGLHCYQYSLRHPTVQAPMTFQAVPTHWRRQMGNDWFDQLAHSQSWNA